MPLTEAFAGIAVADCDSALPWYERLLGDASDVVTAGRHIG
jgi:hypothetical protein